MDVMDHLSNTVTTDHSALPVAVLLTSYYHYHHSVQHHPIMAGHPPQRKLLLDVTLVVGATGVSACIAFFGLIHLKKRYMDYVCPYKYRACSAMVKSLLESEW